MQCLHTQFKLPKTKISVIQKMLLKNIDQEIELILINQHDLDSFVRGYHAYLYIWIPKDAVEKFCLKSENENQHDKFAVAIVLEERIVWHGTKS